jgi:hypothetical protein
MIGIFYGDSLSRTVGIMGLFPGGDGQQWLSLPGILLILQHQRFLISLDSTCYFS